MTCFFTPEVVEQLHSNKSELHNKLHRLRESYIRHSFTNERAREFANHGFCRRVGMLIRSIDVVFEQLPPELDEIPAHNEVDDATIAIQSFLMNTYGCLDNLAWIWVHEAGIRNPNGSEIDRKRVGLLSPIIKHSLPSSFRSYLDTRNDWFEHIKNFRDSLAHRIPLYIPPFMVSSEHADEYQRLDNALFEALRHGDLNTCDSVRAEQRRFTFFRPWMTHSFYENAPKVIFHSQILNDGLTIDEIGQVSLRELASIGRS